MKLRDHASRAKSYVRLHWIRILMLAVGMATLAVVVGFWSFWVREIPMRLAALSKLILDFAHRHPHVSRVLHVSLETVPDLAFVLLALAGLSYLMPELMKKFETSRALRVSAFVIFSVFGIAAVIMNSVSREDQENQGQINRNKIDLLSGQVHDTLQFLVQSKGQPSELERRKHILDTLRSEYILTHPEASAAMIAGNADAPSEWMNKQLQELGEQWKYVPPLPALSVPARQRSYLVFDGNPKSAGGQTEGSPLAVGQGLDFNVHYKQQGPNPVELVRVSNCLYVEADYQVLTQRAVIRDFEERLKKEKPPGETSTLMLGDQGFFTAFGRNEDGSRRIITQTDLDNFTTGKQVVFFIAQLIYRDAGKEHRLRRCLFLQPPAAAPWVWAFCGGFTHSD
ncbi:MAG: hypothetical protein ABSE93_11650 [Terriglobia bacterium]